ncbi:MAG: hypothetical protein Q8936_22175 [Bacillota bacterium]|nr:hypothetical protein [Bacillota bacterium]
MEEIKQDSNIIGMNIDSFSRMIGEHWNVKHDIFKNYIFANLSVGLVKNSDLRNEINNLYNLDKLTYYNAAKNSSCINHVIMTQGTLEQEVYGRKALGILIIAETDYKLRDKIIRLLRKYNPIVYNAVKKHNIKQLSKKYCDIDEVTRVTESRLDSSIYFYLSMYRSPELVDQACIESIINDIKYFEFNDPMTRNIDTELILLKHETQQIKSLIKRQYGKIHNYKDILNNDSEYIREIGYILENLFIINKLDINHLFSNFNYVNISEIILSLIKEENELLENNEVILNHLIYGIFIKSLLGEYKKVRNLYFENYQETLFFRLSSLEEKLNAVLKENTELKSSLSILEKEKESFNQTLTTQINKLNKAHKSETNDLQNKIKELEAQLLEEKNYRRELNALREYIFYINNSYIPPTTNDSLEDYTDIEKLLIIGGTKEWRRRFREKYPKLRTLNGFNENFEISTLNSYDYIFFYTGYMNHATYYKAINYIRLHQLKFGYIGKTNIDLVEQEIIEEILQLAK